MTYDIPTITTELADLVGFDSSEGFVLSSDLTSSDIKLNNYHPLLQLSILDNVRPSQTSLSDWLINVRNSSITTLLNDLVTKKLTINSIKTKLSDTVVFDSTARFSNLEPVSNRFVGWTFRPIKSSNLVHTIKSIALQALQPVTNLPIYLYQSSQKEPISTTNITTTKSSSVDWVELTTPITFSYDGIDSGGYYLIGYYEADLLTSSTSTNRAIYKEHNLSLKACGTCNIFNTKAYNIWSKYMNIDTIYVNSGDLDGTNLPSNEKINRQSNKNYGLNFKISTACDLTNFLVTNKSLLLPTLQIRYSIDLLRYVDMNPLRKNTVTDSVKNEAFTAINGVVSENNYVKVRGLIHEYKDYLDGLNFDTSVLDPVCLANVRKGITWNKSKADLY